MSFPAPPDFPITPILRGRGVNAVKRDLQFKPPYASTPKSRIHIKVAAKDTVIEKGKAAMTVRHQNKTAAVKPLNSKNLKSSNVMNLLQSKPLGNRNQRLEVVPLTSEVKTVKGNAGVIQMTVEKLAKIGKTVSAGIEKTTRGDDQRTSGGQVDTKASLVESKDVENGKSRLGLRSGRVKPLDDAVKVTSGPRKVAGESEMRNGHAPGLCEGNEIIDNNFGLIPKQRSLSTLHEESLVQETTEAASRLSSFRAGNVKAAVWKTLTSQAAGSKGLLPSKDERSGTAAAQVNSHSALRSSEEDPSVGRNPSEIKSLTSASNSRSSKTNESKLKEKSAEKVKSVIAQTIGSTDIVKTTVNKSTRRASNMSAADKERISVAAQNSANVVKTTARKSLGSVADVSTARKECVSASTISRLRVPVVKPSAKITSQVTASQASTIQSMNSERLTSHLTDSVLTKSDSTRSHGNVRETSVGSARLASVKRTARKRFASAEISSVLENSGEIGDDAGRSTVPNNEFKKRKVVVEDCAEDLRAVDRSQTERRFFKQKISKPKNLLPNSSQEKVVKQAQHVNRRKSIEQKDIELKVKPEIYQRWKVASKPTVEFVAGTLVQSFEEKFNLQKLDVVDLVNFFEELKTRIVSEVSLIKVPTSRPPVNYSALTTQQSTLAMHLDESTEDVQQIGNVIRNCKGSNKKLKILNERLQSKCITTTEADRLCEASALEKSQSTHESLQTIEQSNASETQKA